MEAQSEAKQLVVNIAELTAMIVKLEGLETTNRFEILLVHCMIVAESRLARKCVSSSSVEFCRTLQLVQR